MGQLLEMVASSAGKTRFPRAAALEVARELCAALRPTTERLIVAGSLRRRRETVGDVEILYIGCWAERPAPGEMFEQRPTNLADEAIAELEARGVLERRLNSKGSESYGAKNKLMRHRASGIPVDLFSATTANWFNYLVCRTGPAESNTRIASLALARGWH